MPISGCAAPTPTRFPVFLQQARVWKRDWCSPPAWRQSPLPFLSSPRQGLFCIFHVIAFLFSALFSPNARMRFDSAAGSLYIIIVYHHSLQPPGILPVGGGGSRHLGGVRTDPQPQAKIRQCPGAQRERPGIAASGAGKRNISRVNFTRANYLTARRWPSPAPLPWSAGTW